MSLIANLLWIVLGGIIAFFLYLLGGIVLCATIIGIPFGIQLFKLAMLSLAPFGHRVSTTRLEEGILPILMNVLWWVFGGVELAIVHVVFAVLCAITIIGLPFARQHMKMALLALVPFGARIE
jgi:uncharacterized membrane protein YccF (DUF307 family)